MGELDLNPDRQQRGTTGINLHAAPTGDFPSHIRQKTTACLVRSLFKCRGHLLTTSPADPRQQLNNLLQSRGMINDLQWDISSQGPAHERVWLAICLSWFFSWQFVDPYSSSSSPTVKGKELGNGRAYRKGKAKDEAAQMAFEALSSNPPPKVSTLRRRNSFP
jgi:hypothetical protein